MRARGAALEAAQRIDAMLERGDMHVRRTILCLATIFFWAAHDPDMASGQSSELMEAYNSFITLPEQGPILKALARGRKS